MTAELGWSAVEARRQVADYVANVEAERDAPGLSTTVEGPAPVS
jgi:hypothetical protein